MAATKGRAAAPQLTASGTGQAKDVSAAYGTTLFVRHTNGTGSITVQGTADVEARDNGGTTWYKLTTLGFGTIAASTSGYIVDSVFDLPIGVAEVRLTYTAPTGSTGHTLDYEVGTVTGI